MSKYRNYFIWIGSAMSQEQGPTGSFEAAWSFLQCHFDVLNENGDFVADHTDKWNMTWPSFLLCLTQSLILHQDSKNTVAIAYLCSFVSFLSLLYQLLVSFLVHAIFLNWLCNHWSGNLRLIYLPADCKGFIKQHLRKGYIWGKNNYSFHLLLHIIVVSKRINTVSLLVSERQGLLKGAEGFYTVSPPGKWLLPLPHLKVESQEHHDLHLEQPMKGIR